MKFVRLAVTGLVSGVVLAYGAPGRADTAEEKLENLDQKVRVLERHLENAEEDAAAKAKQNPLISAGDKGFSIKSADGNYELKLRGYVQVDSRNFLGDDTHALANTFLVRRSRLIIDGTVAKYVDFRVMPDFGGSAVSLVDAYADVKYWPEATVRVGRFKPAVSLLRLQSDTDLVFSERGLVTDLTTDRDIGVQVGGALADGAFNYALGVFNGAADSAGSTTDAADQKDVVARLFFQPWHNNPGFLQGLGFGVAGTEGHQVGSADVGKLNSIGQQSIFAYKSTVVANGRHTRLIPQLNFYRDNFGLVAEYARSSQEVAAGTAHTALDHTAWDVEFNWVVTGEDASYKGVKPKVNFTPGKDGWGALEIGLRAGVLNIDDKAFSGSTYADPAVSVTEARDTGVGINWYLSPNVKLALDYDLTRFDGGAAKGADRPTEKLVLGRAQFQF